MSKPATNRPAREETMIGKRQAMRLAAAGVLVGAGGFMRPAAAQQKFVFKASDVHPEGYPTVTAVEEMGKELDKATSGRLSVQMYASMQLGGEKEAIEQAQIGAIALARVSVGALGPVVNDLNVLNLHFCFETPSTRRKCWMARSGRSFSTRSRIVRPPI
jgi:TRAP-type C4-dicarboxylate transport system substrate-binding protein